MAYCVQRGCLQSHHLSPGLLKSLPHRLGAALQIFADKPFQYNPLLSNHSQEPPSHEIFSATDGKA